MAFIVGNVSDSLYPASVKTALANDNSPVYGVDFSTGTGVRLYDAIGKIVTPSTDTTKGVDDFENLPPFNIKECITQYNVSSGKREVLAYKGDRDWDNLVAAKTGDRMIEFPCFWYKRVGSANILISPNAKEGFKPSAAHFRNGVLYDKLRISKFFIDSNTAASQVGTATALGDVNSLRSAVRAKGGWLIDPKCQSMLIMLALVKHAVMHFETYYSCSTPGTASPISTGTSQSILGTDGYNSNSTVIFGLENVWGYAGTVIDGLYALTGNTDYRAWSNVVYYIDVMDITSPPTTNDILSHPLDTYAYFGNNHADSGTKNLYYGIYSPANYDWFIAPTVAAPDSVNSTYGLNVTRENSSLLVYTSVLGILVNIPNNLTPITLYTRFFEFE